MTTSPVMTVTDELLAELEDAAGNATQDAWELLPGTNLSGPEVIANGEPIAWVLNSEADAVHIALANPATIAALTAELRRLRADNAELEQSLAESRANDQASMAWLSAYRVAARGGDMPLPEMVSHIEGLARDAGRLEWMVTEGAVIARMNGTGLPMCYQVSFPLESCQQLDWFPSWREAVDAMMATQ